LFLYFKCKSSKGEICWTKLDKIVFCPISQKTIRPKAKLRFEVLFKKFHSRLNRTTLYLTRSYLLNTMKPISGLETRSLTKFQKPLQNLKNLTRGVPLGTWISNSEYFVLLLDTHNTWQKTVGFVPILSRNLYRRYPLDSKFCNFEY
jgi:hypothetical protein